ncbi:MAG: MaoC family dehydratase [Alphaproteobacteria bacterium]|nr:MaoC family dehydratase [Alphaproteobacteria bacterium]
MPLKITGAEGLRAHANQPLGATDWEPMTFERILAFADATDDHQWIHVDRERIAKESPFGAPLAHGYLTMSLIGGKFFQLLELDGFKMIINYGAEKLRFPSPLTAGKSFRLAVDMGEVTEKGKGWLQVSFHTRIEIEGEDKPACAAEVLYRFLPA